MSRIIDIHKGDTIKYTSDSFIGYNKLIITSSDYRNYRLVKNDKIYFSKVLLTEKKYIDAELAVSSNKTPYKK